ncbi:sulfite exporter TauE/SafE family protein [Olsenella uli]|uniref:sulfite exporter TauE/SafE family protein n=1 Tax=Olsenella uli TaxID=133926 RepID=UPI0012ABFEE9|nr:sulfite exporter TauE/SafE family protein [Olsenella uli]
MLDLIIICVVCFLASTLGPLCGIGGGVIIKPIVDSLGIMGMSTTSFLSSLTVLTMSLATLAQEGWARLRHPDAPRHPYPPTAIPLSLGAAAGGVAGKVSFNAIQASLGNANAIGATQAAVLFVLSASTVVYTLNRSRIRTLSVSGAVPSAVIGAVTGALWAFLGIGGGPFNLVILTLLFSSGTKEGARESILIIAFSQVASFAYTLASGNVPQFSPVTLVAMASMAVVGSIAGKRMASRMDVRSINRLYALTLVVVMALCVRNFIALG